MKTPGTPKPLTGKTPNCRNPSRFSSRSTKLGTGSVKNLKCLKKMTRKDQ